MLVDTQSLFFHSGSLGQELSCWLTLSHFFHRVNLRQESSCWLTLSHLFLTGGTLDGSHHAG